MQTQAIGKLFELHRNLHGFETIYKRFRFGESAELPAK